MSDPVVLLSTGDVVGPAGGVTDNSMVLFNGTSGKLIKGNNAVVTTAGLALLDDVNAAAQRATLGLGNVDNTSDVNKPISTATQTALNLKAPLYSPAFTGIPTAPTASVGTSTTQVATTEFVNAEIANDALSIWGGVVNGRTVLQKAGQVDYRSSSIEVGATDGGQAILAFHRHGVEAGTLRLNGGFYFDNNVTSSGAVNATNLFGQSQSWQLVSRAAGVTYTNDTGRPLAISIYGPQFSNNWSVFHLYISGQRVACQRNHTNYSGRNWISGVVPIGATYQLNVEQTGIESWFEYR